MNQLTRRMKNKNKIISSTLGLFLLVGAQQASAQSAYKEASNAFAMYSQTGDIKNLDNARKQIENIYKTRRDSSKTKVNVLRAMVMSSIAYADSTRTIKLNADPIDLTYQTLGKIEERDQDGYPGELDYVKQNLAAALIYRANKSLVDQKYDAAFEDFSKVDALNAKSGDVTYNLALLATKAGKSADAIKYYKAIHEGGEMTAEQFIELANLYDKQTEQQLALSTLEEAKTKFPENKDVLFLLIDKYAKNGAYDAIVPIVDQALKFEPENIELNYMAGYANENANNIELASTYYQKVLELDPNNYESNLALGLINLNKYLKDGDNQEAQYDAQNFLLKANEIKPYEINALKSLALYYQKAEDDTQLDRVNLLLNQLTN
ncbi:tetratricopeptide repeat protein [Sphingobacterium lactis]|uniref:tetratricopeptide repeat protein n=1 Tax=Sphingobacterium lactis TaxID=797291 RepID=UPI003DA5E56B